MVAIYLRNTVKSPIKSITIQISSDANVCEVTDIDGKTEQVETQAYLSTLSNDFQHPLLRQSSAPFMNGAYCIQYKGLKGLATIGARFYATLIREWPTHTPIRIQYVGAYEAPSHVEFSIDAAHAAHESLNISQFESFVSSQTSIKSFRWFEGLLFDETMSIDTLPCEVNADSLFEGVDLTPDVFTEKSAFELRFISDKVGLGVFARTALPTGKTLFMYSGRAVLSADNHTSYYHFQTDDNCFKRNIEAMSEGCYSRFVNHAPDDDQANCLSANLIVEYESYFGISLAFYKTKRPIQKGEQLFFDYGPNYWKEKEAGLFPKSKDVPLVKQYGMRSRAGYAISRHTLHNMAVSGITKAQFKILRRPIFFLFLSLGVVYCLNHYY